jgi:hypothetical protein
MTIASAILVNVAADERLLRSDYSVEVVALELVTA